MRAINDLELPLSKRSPLYRFFEIIPGAFSYGMLALMVVFSLINPLWASVYLLLLIVTMILKAAGIAFHSIVGSLRLRRSQRIDWSDRLNQLSDPSGSLEKLSHTRLSSFDHRVHADNLRQMALDPEAYPKPSDVYHLIVIAAYNEPYEVIRPTIESLIAASYDSKRMIVVFGYEERGGGGIESIVMRLRDEYQSDFYAFVPVKHPSGMPDEVVGKGPNITYAAQQVLPWLDQEPIDADNIIVTTLDCDNKPHKSYFDYLTYEYIVNQDRMSMSFQPIALYFGNIWDAPAPMRIIAIGNSFWTIVSSVRPHTLRNFAAHSQPLTALREMGFWSKRSIVEDGHQYWRSYFHFRGKYDITPLYLPIYQDAVLGETLKSTLVAQFKQLRRWGYGASDIPYVAVRLFSRRRSAPFWPTLARFIRLVDSHVSLATVALLIAVGAWVPLILNPEAAHNISAHNLPHVVSTLQRAAMFGLAVTIVLSIGMLPSRPSRLRRHRTIWMLLQWVLMPLTAILYNSMASLNAQTHLMLGRYLDKFDVTEKTTRD